MRLTITFFFQILNFIVLYLFLRKYFFRPVSAYLERRREHIEGELKRVKEEREDAQKLKEGYMRELQDARRKAKEIVDKALKHAEELKKDRLASSQEEASHLVSKAQEEIKREKEKAIASLRDEIAGLSVSIASRIIREKMNDEIHHALVKEAKEAIEEMKRVDERHVM